MFDIFSGRRVVFAWPSNRVDAAVECIRAARDRHIRRSWTGWTSHGWMLNEYAFRAVTSHIRSPMSAERIA